jgi:hypothetical protein
VDALSQLPDRVSAVETRLADLQGEFVSFRAEVRGEFARINDRLASVDARFAAVRKEIRDGDEETRRQMRVLHEEVIARLALIQEGRSSAKPPSPPKTRRRKRG